MAGIRWTEDEFRAWQNTRNNRAAVQTPDVEPATTNGCARENPVNEVHQRVRIHVHSRRRRLADPDGISAKAAIDGLAKAGLFPDDSAHWVESVSFSQEVSKIEETVITVEIVK